MAPQPATPTQPRRLKIFLCHASADKPAVRDLYHRLRAAGFDPWLDEENLLPGQDWQLEIEQAVQTSDAVVVCLSQKAVTKAGYVHTEIQHALDIAARQPEGAIFLIPLRLEDCDVPHRLRRWHWVDLYHDKGYDRLLLALRARAKALGLPTHPFEPEMIRIPAGEFLYGDEKETRELPEFWIDRTPVTNAEYARFVAETGYEPPTHWEAKSPPEDIADHPVGYVSWDDAAAYAEWAGKRLPTEEEWEKAARGTDGRAYPWGDGEPTSDLCNFVRNEGGTTPVGKYSPRGDSPYGCADMAGNVWEWTASDYDDKNKVLRGGSWFVVPDYLRSAFRGWTLQDTRLDYYGFRCARGSQ